MLIKMISKGIISKKIINSLWQRWPDPDLLKSYYTLLEILKKGSQRLAKELDELSYISFKAFQEVCQFVIDIQSENPSKNIKSYSCKIGLDPPQNIILNKDKWANLNKLQNIASLLGMLMHFSPCAESPGLLANRRRPKKRFTTYPTSPSVTSLLAYYSLKHSLTNPIPSCCRSLADAKSYVKRSLSFRILQWNLANFYWK